MANRSDRDRQRPKNDASIIARPFVRQPIRENHQGLRSMNRAARPDTRQQALVSPEISKVLATRGRFSNRSFAVKTFFASPARVTVLSAVSTSCRNIWSGPEAPALQGPQRAYA
jgi:hypothetical protein